MVKYPNEIFEGRTVENLPGIEYNEDDKKTVYAEDINNANGEIQAIEQTLGKNVNGDSDTVADRLDEIESLFGQLEEVMDTKIAAAKSALFPVGSIYFNGVDDTNPATLLGFGTWAAYATGRVLGGLATSGTFGTLGDEFGEEKHIMTVSELVSHRHDLIYGTNTGGAGQRATVMSNNGPFQSGNPITNTGGGAPFNIIQPTKVTAIWIRTV